MAELIDLRVRAWYEVERAIRKVRPGTLAVGLRSVHAGLLLGTATPALLEAIDAEAYRRRYAYHGTDDHDLRGLFPWEQAALRAAFPPSGHLLVTAAGGGREVVALQRLGYRVTAAECNEALRARANELLRRLGLEPCVAAAPRDACPTSGGPFDAAILGWGSYSFVRGAERRRALLAELAGGLRPGAPALISFFHRTRDARRLRVIRDVARAVGAVAGGVPVELGDLVDPCWQHAFDRSEIEREVLGTGLALEAFSTEGYGHALLRRLS
jgi:hypothetical protein